MSETDAVRRQELQRRLYAPGGSLTAEEIEELRMLSAPSSGHGGASTDSATQEPGAHEARVPEPDPRAREALKDATRPSVRGVASEGAVTDGASTGSATQSVQVPETDPDAVRTRRRPLLIPAVVAVSLLIGAGIGWLTLPHVTVRTTPTMTAAQEKEQREIARSGDVDADSLEFAGAKHGASVWTASHGEQKCVVIAARGQRGVACADPEKGSYGAGVISAAVQTDHDGAQSSLTAMLVRALTGEWTVLIERWEMGPGDDSWQQQYSEAEMRLVEALQEAGFAGRNLVIIGHDDDLPIWVDYGPRHCVAVVDPGTLEVSQACGTGESEETVDLAREDSIYSVRWTQQRGAVLTILRTSLEITKFVCDTDGTCNPIDEDEN